MWKLLTLNYKDTASTDKDLNQLTMMTKYAVIACPTDLRNNRIENLFKDN